MTATRENNLLVWSSHDPSSERRESVQYHADLPGRRALRSASTSRPVIPPIKLSTVGSRAFLVAAAQVLNSLQEAVISSSSLQSFRRQLKTHLSQLSYPHLILWLLIKHHYSGPGSNIVLGHFKNLCLLTYLLTWGDQW